MDVILANRVHFILDRLDRTPPTGRLLIAIAGVPASGKSSFALRLVQQLNARRTDHAVLVGLDGWHLTRAQLDAMHDHQHAHDRRGAHWTFDAPAYLDFVNRVRDPSVVVHAPSFDHALKDPVADDVEIVTSHRVVVVEGLYTMLDVEPWRRAAALMDERWWVDVDPARAKARLVARHVKTGVARDMDEAIWRADNNDVENGKFIAANLFDVTYTIQSVDDPVYTN